MFNISPYGRVAIGAKASDDYNFIFQVNGAMWSDNIFANTLNVAGAWISSDERLKTDVKPLSNCLQNLCKLEGNSYNKSNQLPSSSKLKSNIPSSPQTESTIDLDEVKKVTCENDVFMGDVLAKNKQSEEFGFMAQDVQKVFPELVKKDEDSEVLSINYIGLIPVIIEALKDQNKTINEQKAHISQLEELIQNKNANIMESKSGVFNFEPADIDENNQNDGNNNETPKLNQNSPNPFNVQTVISYVVPFKSVDAAIYIYDLNGNQKEVYPIVNKGSNEITIHSGSLSPGIYLYALIIDGKEVDIKRMILTK